ncbi:PWWP domain-containing protein [Clathrospora elynae]|uniref:PWWP domain-containing protein n=1 Tax=Clathrospora elynae TaxID=706981 RepID=A0A6A5SZS2_9PLEO|nr:PWWP domain-containing protein [Clathrospora elynae]
MAEEANAPVSTDAAKGFEEPTRSADAVAEPAVAEAQPAEDGVVATSDAAEVPATDAAQDNADVKDEVTADAQADTATAGDDTDAAPVADAPLTNGTPAAKKAPNGKRKSSAGVPEHKKKTPAKKGKKTPELRLNVSPGDMHMVAMRGFPPWPVIVCDEEMLPESLLVKRPVSAKRIDGTYREDFLEGGKNAKDRRYPIMFLGTNEFAWQVNTELLPFDIEDVKKDVESGNQAKKSKALSEAYQTAAEGHELSYFKEVLQAHDHAMQEDNNLRDQKEMQKKEKAAKRKSTVADESEDVEMEDAGDDAAPSAKKAKATKKRKKEDESNGENEKPVKTPKMKVKLNAKTPKDASTAKPKKEHKPKKKSSEEAGSAVPEEPPMTEHERLQKREKQILYLRHRMQKGFLSRDQAPKDEDMANMSEYLKQLEAHEDLEATVIKNTKVHKVLRAIIKLDSIPQEDVFGFKKRSNDLLSKWSGALASDIEPVAANGVKHEDEEKTPPAKEEVSAEKTTEDVHKDETPAESAFVKTVDKDGDVTMSEADEEVIKEAPAVEATVEISTEDGDKATTETATAAAATDATSD